MNTKRTPFMLQVSRPYNEPDRISWNDLTPQKRNSMNQQEMIKYRKDDRSHESLRHQARAVDKDLAVELGKLIGGELHHVGIAIYSFSDEASFLEARKKLNTDPKCLDTLLKMGVDNNPADVSTVEENIYTRQSVVGR